jgi:PH (Pleckstrin Homology) domain-containing protein
MTSSDPDRPKPPATAGNGQPQYADRVYRSMAGVCGGVLLLVLAAWLGGDAIVRGAGNTPWLALASLLLAVPLIIAFTLRPAVYAGAERIRIRNPFRTITLPWSQVDSVRASYSTELFTGGRKYQLWAIPVSLRARKRAARQDARAKAAGEERERQSPFGLPPVPARRRPPIPGEPGADGTIRSYADQAIAELRDLSDRHPAPEDPPDRAPAAVRWAYELIAPSAAGALTLAALIAAGV